MSDDEIELDDDLLEAASGGVINLPSSPSQYQPPTDTTYNSTIYFTPTRPSH